MSRRASFISDNVTSRGGAENGLRRRLHSNKDPIAELRAASDGFKAW
jgi:hypothetical protein